MDSLCACVLLCWCHLIQLLEIEVIRIDFVCITHSKWKWITYRILLIALFVNWSTESTHPMKWTTGSIGNGKGLIVNLPTTDGKGKNFLLSLFEFIFFD